MPSETAKVFVDNLDTLRRQLGLSLAKLAKQAGVPQRTLSHICSNPRAGFAPNLRTIEQIANALGISVADLLSPGLRHVGASSPVGSFQLARQLGRLAEDFLVCDEKDRNAILRFVESKANPRR